MTPDYGSYTQDDFLEDQFFIQWVKYKSPAAELFWNNWASSNPGNINAFRAAEEQLKIILSARRLRPEATDEEEVWQHIIAAIDAEQTKTVPFAVSRRNWLVAASVAAIILLSAGTFWLLHRNTTRTVAAGYGQLITVRLPDASIVKLNANSEIEYQRSWNNSKPREIYLKGEAFFIVEHLNKNISAVKNNERFIVHTDHLKIEVLGTAFNVKERRGKTAVSLETGSLKVQLQSDSLQQLLLAPGELAEYDDATKEFKKINDEPAVHKDWTEKKMLASNTTVADIVQELEDIYGYQIILEDPELSNRRIDGIIPLKSESNVLFILSNILNVDIEKKNNQMIFRTRK